MSEEERAKPLVRRRMVPIDALMSDEAAARAWQAFETSPREVEVDSYAEWRGMVRAAIGEEQDWEDLVDDGPAVVERGPNENSFFVDLTPGKEQA